VVYGGRLGGNIWIFEVVRVAVWIAVAIAVVVLLLLAFRWLARQGGSQAGAPPAATPPTPPTPPAAGPDAPLEILRQRYARGEIDDDEYERRRKVLGG
jgi:putative membrane protein